MQEYNKLVTKHWIYNRVELPDPEQSRRSNVLRRGMSSVVKDVNNSPTIAMAEPRRSVQV